jgi:hypothetical protein
MKIRTSIAAAGPAAIVGCTGALATSPQIPPEVHHEHSQAVSHLGHNVATRQLASCRLAARQDLWKVSTIRPRPVWLANAS